jgi:triacylglycerol lipase
MRRYFLIILLFNVTLLHGQLAPEYSKSETLNAIALCNSFTFLEVLKNDDEIIPAGFKKVYTSTATATDNLFQIYQHEKVGYLVFRGSTSNMYSWMQNISSAMIPAKGAIEINGETFNYKFANDTSAAVHGGYALGVVLMSKEIINQIKQLHHLGIEEFLITGHSQGGSLAVMTRAYLENLPKNVLASGITYKTYAFAAPLVGNRAFAAEYSGRYCTNQSSFSIVNPKDPVPNFPMGFKDGANSGGGLIEMLANRGSADFKGMMLGELFRYFNDTIAGFAGSMGANINKQISDKVGKVVMPPNVKDAVYGQHGNRIEIVPADAPKVLVNPEILKNDSLMAIYPRDAEGNFTDASVYKPESQWYQHKPYNYYTSVLKMYFPNQFKSLKRLYPPGT